MNRETDPQINRPVYEWTIRVITTLKNILRVNLHLHQTAGEVESGDIFVFNHFTRFETFIPQYLIFKETGVICRTVASSTFFVEESPLSNYLLQVGAVPNNHPRLLPFLAEEILRGRKVIIFPEGGMVKDRRVLDEKGRFRIYSPTAGTTRKHHAGAAVLALLLDEFKGRILKAHAAGDTGWVRSWVDALGLENEEALVAAVRKPTVIVPGNITFYPIRVNDNILRRMAELLNRRLSRRLSEELRIEGNILLKDTDMDVRLGEPVRALELWPRHERQVALYLARRIDSLDGLFGLTPAAPRWQERLAGRLVRRGAWRIRDECMRRMYAEVTVNLSHLASLLILSYLDKGQTEVDETSFRRALYLAVKNAQRESSIRLHRSLRSPEEYGGLLGGSCPGLDQFLTTAASMDLLAVGNGRIGFLPKLHREHKAEEIRIENLVVVYANEAAPVRGTARSVERALAAISSLEEATLARLRFDDEMVAYSRDRERFSQPSHREINEQETAGESGEPFLWVPDRKQELGVVLVHGFLASPAEVRPLGEKLAELGYPVLGVRLKGHGTSPWDLRERGWRDWLDSVRGGYEMMSAFARRICLIGFSAGGALALRLAADRPERLAGVAAVSVPVKFRDRSTVFAPLVHGANVLVRWVSSREGVMPFRPQVSEHPHINYRHVPIRGLYELRKLIDDMEEHLPEIRCPVTIVQGNGDPIVDPKSADLITRSLGSREKNLVMIPSSRHGILYENIGKTHQIIISFLAARSVPEPTGERMIGYASPALGRPSNGGEGETPDAPTPQTPSKRSTAP